MEITITEQTLDQTIQFKINGLQVKSQPNMRLLDVIRDAGYEVPGLCHKPESEGESACSPGSCRLCQVEINGHLATACEHEVQPGLDIRTDTPKVRAAQQFALDLICEAHQGQCLDCPANLTCRLQEACGRLKAPREALAAPSSNGNGRQKFLEESFGPPLFAAGGNLESLSIQFDSSLCIRCGRCSAVCPTAAIGPVGRGVNRIIGAAPGMDFAATCINCGQCTKVCPTGALTEQSHVTQVEAALADSQKTVVFQIAPAVRVALGEEFDLAPGQQITGKIYAALRKLGTPYESPREIPLPFEGGQLDLRSNVIVTDTNVTADLTILEEGTEIISRIQNGGKLPVLTSCCPAWIKYVESYHPELMANLCTAKSPQQMMGTLIKTFGAQTWGIDPADLVSVSVMPCTAKKFEAQRPEMNASGYQDVDYVLTTRELARMLKNRGLKLERFSDEAADYPFEEYTGAGTIFGNTGGVMEAALRTLYFVLSGRELTDVNFAPVRGMANLKEAEVEIDGLSLKVAILHNLNNEHTDKLIQQILQSEDGGGYAAIEVMACPGGCIGGGGQPKEFDNWQVKALRTQGLNEDDRAHRFRRSHSSPVVERIYAEKLGEPNSHEAHELCHTHYIDRSPNIR